MRGQTRKIGNSVARALAHTEVDCAVDPDTVVGWVDRGGVGDAGDTLTST